ncbi:MAG TPA: response regulator [Ignavibacteriaceae bacterium]|nr:response regulator [Ignavibacteriaceae bacterium]
MALFILALVLFIIFDILIRYIGRRMNEKKAQKDRAKALEVSLQLDYSTEAKTLKRAEVQNPKAKILCVDDEPIILDSFRKILVLDGYSVDTVEKGQEALGLIQKHHYDFVFTDLKMPEMNGLEVTKSVKHLRPDIDVVIITGYATVETAVDCMKYGAMDYVQKPFTEDELLDFVKSTLIKRQDKINKQLKPKVHITHLSSTESMKAGEFSIPGGVFISNGHCWAGMDQEGTVKVGIDDFARKLIGRIDDFEFPNLGMTVKKGQPLFSVKQGQKTITFNSPVSGQVKRINSHLKEEIESLSVTPYDSNWICIIDADNMDNEIKELKIGNAAVSFYQDDIENFRVALKGAKRVDKPKAEITGDEFYIGELENLEANDWNKMVQDFFIRRN